MTGTPELPPLPEPDGMTDRYEVVPPGAGTPMNPPGTLRHAGRGPSGQYTAETVQRLMRAYAAEAVRVARQADAAQPVAWVDPAAIAWLRDTARSPLAHTQIDLCLSSCGRQTMPLYATPPQADQA